MTVCACGAPQSDKDIGVEVSGIYDGVLLWECGVCHALRPRFDPPGRLHDRGWEIIRKWEEQQ